MTNPPSRPLVLMDREFDSQHLLESIAQRGLTYVVPKRMYTSEKAQAKRLLKRGQDYYTSEVGQVDSSCTATSEI